MFLHKLILLRANIVLVFRLSLQNFSIREVSIRIRGGRKEVLGRWLWIRIEGKKNYVTMLFIVRYYLK